MKNCLKKIDFKEITEILNEYDIERYYDNSQELPDSSVLSEKLSEYVNISEIKPKAVLGIDLYKYGSYADFEQTLIPFIFKLLFEEALKLCIESNQYLFQKYTDKKIREAFISIGDGGYLIFDNPLHALVYAINFDMVQRAYNSYHIYPKLRKIVGGISNRYAITYEKLYAFDNNYYGRSIINNARILSRDHLNRCLLSHNTYDWFLLNMDGIENLQLINLYDIDTTYEFANYDSSLIETGKNIIINKDYSRNSGIINSDILKIGTIQSKESLLNRLCHNTTILIIIDLYQVKSFYLWYMAYRYGNRTQITYLPDSVDQYVGQDDPVRVYDAFIDALGSEGLGIKLDENSVGNSSYHPLTMLKILTYGYSYGWRSSRKLERALHHNLSFIWLAGGLKPDHKTISSFRKENKEALKNVLTQCARMCIKLNLIEGNTLFVDGSKFRANAGNSQTKSKQTWEKYRDQVDEKISSLLEECQKVDKNEKESLVAIEKALKSKKKLKEKIDELLLDIKNEETINGTDPDCKIMKGRQGSHTGYNSQITTDGAYGLITSTDVSTSKNDLNQLGKQIENTEKALGKISKNVCADAGYSNVDVLKPMVDSGKMVVVPTSKQAQKETKEEPFGKQAFIYNAEKEIYICPAGKELYRSYQMKNDNKIVYRVKNKTTCLNCTYFGVCTKSSRGRSLNRLINEETKELLEDVYESKEGQKIYEKRKMVAELPFGHIKRNLGAGAFLLRGLDGAKAELSLLATCFNIARLVTIMGGVRPMIEKLRYIE
jgi:transposase